MLSVPILAIYVFALNWQLAVFAGAFCGLGGAMTEILLQPAYPCQISYLGAGNARTNTKSRYADSWNHG